MIWISFKLRLYLALSWQTIPLICPAPSPPPASDPPPDQRVTALGMPHLQRNKFHARPVDKNVMLLLTTKTTGIDYIIEHTGSAKMTT